MIFEAINIKQNKYVMPMIESNESNIKTGEFLPAVFLQGIGSIFNEQLISGEMPAYRHNHDGSYSYCRSLLNSNYIYSELSSFDMQSREFNTKLLDIIPINYQREFFYMVNSIRHKIRGFVAWQQESTDVWRFFGRSSGVIADACTTAKSAGTLLKTYKYNDEDIRNKVSIFKSSVGLYHTFVDDNLAGYAWMDEEGTYLGKYDPIVNAVVIEYLSQIGEPYEAPLDYLLSYLAQSTHVKGTRNFPNPLSVCYILSRLIRVSYIHELKQFDDRIISTVTSHMDTAGDNNGVLDYILMLSTLTDLGYCGKESAMLQKMVTQSIMTKGSFPCEDFIVNGYGSSSWTTALALSTLLRCKDH